MNSSAFQPLYGHRAGAAPAAQSVEILQNGKIRAAGGEDPTGLGYVPAVRRDMVTTMLEVMTKTFIRAAP